MVQEATLKFAISATKSKKDASRFLGLTYLEFLNICKKYQINGFLIPIKRNPRMLKILFMMLSACGPADMQAQNIQLEY